MNIVKKYFFLLILPFTFPCFATENPFQDFVGHYTIETDILNITPTYTESELTTLCDFSMDDSYSAISSDLKKSFRLPTIMSESGRKDFCQWLLNHNYNNNDNLPFLFTARLKNTNEIVGFYTYFPYQLNDVTHESCLEQRTLIGLPFRNKGIGTDLRRAMINNFQHHIFEKMFCLLDAQHDPDHPFKKVKVISLMAVVELLNFPSLVSNLKVPFQLTHHDGNDYSAPSCVFFSYPAPSILSLSELENIYQTIFDNPHFEEKIKSNGDIDYGITKIRQYFQVPRKDV